jgi:hypothetical protein
MSGSDQAELDVREPLLRIEQLEVDIRQKRQALSYFRRQFYVNASFAVAALITAVFAGFKAIFGH